MKRKFDIIGMDACLMSMAEVSYQLRDAADFTVGSQEEEPGDGWPYDRVLKALAAKPSMSPRDLSKAIVHEYLQSYGADEGVTQSAVDLTRIDDVAKAVDALSRALSAALADPAARGAIIGVRGQVQEYTSPYDDYVDIVDLCTLLTAQLASPAVQAACTALVDAVEDAVVAEGAKGAKVAHSHGLSIYFPKRQVSPLYGTLDFTKNSKWDEFVDAYLAALRR